MHLRVVDTRVLRNWRAVDEYAGLVRGEVKRTQKIGVGGPLLKIEVMTPVADDTRGDVHVGSKTPARFSVAFVDQ